MRLAATTSTPRITSTRAPLITVAGSRAVMAVATLAAGIIDSCSAKTTELCYYSVVMTLSVDVPGNLDQATLDDLDKAVREFVAVRLYREGRISHGQFAKFLGVGRGVVDEILGRHGVVDMTKEELKGEFDSIRQMGA
jgi:predicted HTH domain antitoxin